MIFPIFLTLALAKPLPGEEIYSASRRGNEEIAQPKSSPTPAKHKGSRGKPLDGNLPSAYGVKGQRPFQSELVEPSKAAADILNTIQVGQKIHATIEHSVIAFPDERAPVLSTLMGTGLKGMKLIGESRLEKNSQRIFIEFNRLILGQKIYQIKAVALTSNGQPGLMGEYHSREAEFFAGDFVSSFVAGYFDGLVPRHTNALGQIETDTTIDTATKKGLSSGAMSSAERFREKLKKVPEFSEIKGPLTIDILILDQAKR